MNNELLTMIGETLDAICTRPFSFKDFSRSDLVSFYAAARQLTEDKPILYTMAIELLKATKPDDTVILATGEYDRVGFLNGETDGPFGTASLARTLHGLGRRVVLCYDPKLTAPHQAIIDRFVGVEFEVAEFPGGPDFDPRAHAASILNEFIPSALIAVEKLGRNSAGVYHAANGEAVTDDDENRIDHLFDIAHEQGLFTLGFGDYGNEIGFGAIYEAAKSASPNGTSCACPCGKGIINVTPTSYVLPCTVSNWGAIGLTDMLAVISDREDLIHKPGDENRLLDAGFAAQVVDGVYLEVRRGVDGFPGETDVSIVRLMAEASLRAIKTRSEYYGK